MIILLDADICSYLRRGVPSVVRSYQHHVLEGDVVGISAITLFEIRFGLEAKLPRTDVEGFLRELVQNIKVFPFSHEAAHQAAHIRATQNKNGRPTGAYDPMLAGHAISLNAELITNNTKHFEGTPKLLLSNWIE